MTSDRVYLVGQILSARFSGGWWPDNNYAMRQTIVGVIQAVDIALECMGEPHVGVVSHYEPEPEGEA